MESSQQISNVKDKKGDIWKITSVVLAVLLVLSLVFTGVFAAKSSENSKKIDDLQSQLNNNSSPDNNPSDSDETSDGNQSEIVYKPESYNEIVGKLQALNPDSKLGGALEIVYFVDGFANARLTGDADREYGNYMALFYKTSGGDWKYFTGIQNALRCEDFNTDDIRKAFRSETCYDDHDNEKTVGIYFGIKS